VYINDKQEEEELGRTELSKRGKVVSYGIKDNSVLYIVNRNYVPPPSTPALPPGFEQDGLPIEVWSAIFSLLPTQGMYLLITSLDKY